MLIVFWKYRRPRASCFFKLKDTRAEASMRTFVAEQLIASPMRASLHNACCRKGRGGICPMSCFTTDALYIWYKDERTPMMSWHIEVSNLWICKCPLSQVGLQNGRCEGAGRWDTTDQGQGVGDLGQGAIMQGWPQLPEVRSVWHYWSPAMVLKS